MIRDGHYKKLQRWKCKECAIKIMDAPAVPLDNFGQLLRSIRNQRGFSMDRAASEIEKTKGWLSRIENGGRGISLDDLYKICSVYKIRVSDMLQRFERDYYNTL